MSSFWTVILASSALGVVNALLLVWELRISRRRGRQIATKGWILSNLSCGVLRTLSVACVQGPIVALYAWVASNVGWTWSMDWWMWVVGFVAIDLAEYLSHHASHKRPFLWAIHAVHHQSPEYNLSLNFRLGMLGPVTTLPFHLLLALVGMPTDMFAILVAVQAAGMVLTHARYPGTLGPFGCVLNAPAWHRVHHSAVHVHRDLNFGAVLIIWDRLFGTFTDGSHVAPRWGIDDELTTKNPLASNLGPWQSLAARVRSTGWTALWRW